MEHHVKYYGREISIRVEAKDMFTSDSVTSQNKITKWDWEQFKKDVAYIMEFYDIDKLEVRR